MALATPHGKIVCTIDWVFVGRVFLSRLLCWMILFVAVFRIRGILVRKSIQSRVNNVSQICPCAIPMSRGVMTPSMTQDLGKIDKKLFAFIV